MLNGYTWRMSSLTDRIYRVYQHVRVLRRLINLDDATRHQVLLSTRPLDLAVYDGLWGHDLATRVCFFFSLRFPVVAHCQ